ncbi:MAG: 30S ribosomal protein S15 [Planctomycetota bacterium]
MAVKDPTKPERIKEFGLHEHDSGSTPVQVANLTHRIRHLTDHLKRFPKDHATRRGLLRMVGRRRALLRYFARTNPAGYKELIQRLGLRR